MKKIIKKTKPSSVKNELDLPKKTSSSKSKVTYFIIAFLAIVAVFLFTRILNTSNIDKFKKTTIPNIVKKLISDPDKTQIKIDKLKESSGIYEFELSLISGRNNQKYTSYITKDGKILFTSGIKIDSLNKAPANAQQNTQKKLTCNDLTKVESSKLTGFVVSDCPYGLQMQRVFKKAIDELPDLANNLNIKYIGSVSEGKITSMHGDKEAQENLRQICIREEQETKYWSYVACYMQEGATDSCISSSGVDASGLKSCMDDKNRGLKYAQADFNIANKMGVSGSPTLILNDKQTVSEFDFGGRVANAIKEIVCCSSKTKADFCSKEISKEAIATSFSTTEIAPTGSGANQAAGCN